MDRTILITGASTGIGAATARALAGQGMRIFITSYRPPVSLTSEELAEVRRAATGGPLLYTAIHQSDPQALVEELRAAGTVCSAWEVDLGDAANIPLLFDHCQAAPGGVDLLVNNHTYDAMESFDPAQDTSEGFPVSLPSAESIDAHFAVNARA